MPEKMREIQWCPHLKVDPFHIPGYTVAHVQATGLVFLIGQGKIRLVCEACTPTYLENVQGLEKLRRDQLSV
jgi:hypothetical protein